MTLNYSIRVGTQGSYAWQERSIPIYLSVSVSIYEEEFDKVFLKTLRTYHIKLLLFDETGESSLQWIDW